MIQVKIEVSGGGGGEGWSIEVERSAHTVRSMTTASDAEAAREMLLELMREVDGLLRGRGPAGPPRPAPIPPKEPS